MMSLAVIRISYHGSAVVSTRVVSLSEQPHDNTILWSAAAALLPQYLLEPTEPGVTTALPEWHTPAVAMDSGCLMAAVFIPDQGVSGKEKRRRRGAQNAASSLPTTTIVPYTAGFRLGCAALPAHSKSHLPPLDKDIGRPVFGIVARGILGPDPGQLGLPQDLSQMAIGVLKPGPNRNPA